MTDPTDSSDITDDYLIHYDPWVSVESSIVDKVYYWSPGQVLEIKLKNGKTYTFYNTTEDDYKAFMASSSKGKAFSDLVQKRKLKKVKPLIRQQAAKDTKSEKSIWFHGTRGKNLQPILANGLIPDPKERSWSEDTGAGFISPSRASYGGVYLTQNLMTAISSANRNKDKGESGVIVIVEAQPRSLVADEDDVNSSVKDVLPHPTEYVVAELYMAKELGINNGWVEDTKREYVDRSVANLKLFRGIKPHPKLEERLRDLISSGFDAALNRQAAYIYEEDWKKSIYRNQSQKMIEDISLLKKRYVDSGLSEKEAYTKAVSELMPSQPDKGKSEKDYAEFVNKLTMTLKELAIPNDRFLQVARSMEPIGYSGKNKILGIVEFLRSSDKDDYSDYLKPIWGNIPEEFLIEWEKRVGDIRWWKDMSWSKKSNVTSRKIVKASAGVTPIVWHGSGMKGLKNMDFAFEGSGVVTRGTKHGGFFFTSEKENAEYFSDPKIEDDPDDYVYAARIRYKNSYETEMAPPKAIAKVIGLNALVNGGRVGVYGQDDEWYYFIDSDSEDGTAANVKLPNFGPYPTEEQAEKAGELRLEEFMKEVPSTPYDIVIVRDTVDGYMVSDIYIALDPSQIEILGSYNDVKKKKGIVAGFKARIKTTSSSDSEYMDAVDRGDEEKAQQMVYEAAKSAGFLTDPMYHGTDSDFSVFSKGGRVGIYVSPSIEYASYYGKKVLKVFVRASKGVKTKTELTTLETSDKGIEWLNSLFQKYDCVLSEPDEGNKELLVRDPNQLKLADAVVRRDDGTVVQLSERFDDGPDIRGNVKSLPYSSEQNDRSINISAAVKNNPSNFESWFKGSKVVDMDGSPIPVYHGTLRGKFDNFDFSRGGENMGEFKGHGGMFFTDSLSVAESYSNPKNRAQAEDNASRYMMSLMARRPQYESAVERARNSWVDVIPYEEGNDKGFEYVVHAFDEWGSEYTYSGKDYYDSKEEAKSYGDEEVESEIAKAEKRLEEYDAKEQAEIEKMRQGAHVVRAYLRITNPAVFDFKGQSSDMASMASFIKEARESGYDGVIFQNVVDALDDSSDASNVYVIFSNDQIWREEDKTSIQTSASGDINSWFGSSVIKTPVWHGSASTPFSEFDSSMSGLNFDIDSKGAFFFTDSESDADFYRKNALEMSDKEDGGFVGRFYIRLENPFQPDSDWMLDNGMAIAIKVAKEEGHDGLAFQDKNGAMVYAVFSPRQIRSDHTLVTKTAASWGKAGSGILYVCVEDGTCLLLLRSDSVLDPNKWGIPGGAIKGTEGIYDEDELDGERFEDNELLSSARQETEEEMGHIPPEGKLLGKTVYNKGGFAYTTFILGVTEEEKQQITQNIRLNWESDAHDWFSIDALPANVHYGVSYAVSQWKETKTANSDSPAIHVNESSKEHHLSKLAAKKSMSDELSFMNEVSESSKPIDPEIERLRARVPSMLTKLIGDRRGFTQIKEVFKDQGIQWRRAGKGDKASIVLYLGEDRYLVSDLDGSPTVNKMDFKKKASGSEISKKADMIQSVKIGDYVLFPSQIYSSGSWMILWEKANNTSLSVRPRPLSSSPSFSTEEDAVSWMNSSSLKDAMKKDGLYFENDYDFGDFPGIPSQAEMEWMMNRDGCITVFGVEYFPYVTPSGYASIWNRQKGNTGALPWSPMFKNELEAVWWLKSKDFRKLLSKELWKPAVDILRHMQAAISPDTAKKTGVNVSLPEDEVFKKCIDGKHARLTEEGLELDVQRNQHPDQEGETAIRSGVFYQPKSSRRKYPYSGKQGYGGSFKYEGTILLRNPLFIKGATGGTAPKIAYDQIKGKGSYEAMRKDVLGIVIGSPSIQRIQAILDKYGGDSSIAFEILRVSEIAGGNNLAYAIQEHIVANVVRDAGYDSILGYTVGRDGTPYFSELFDLREVTYPGESNREGLIHEKFNQSQIPNIQASKAVDDSYVPQKETKRLSPKELEREMNRSGIINLDHGLYWAQGVKGSWEIWWRPRDQIQWSGKLPGSPTFSKMADARQWLIGGQLYDLLDVIIAGDSDLEMSSLINTVIRNTSPLVIEARKKLTKTL